MSFSHSSQRRHLWQVFRAHAAQIPIITTGFIYLCGYYTPLFEHSLLGQEPSGGCEVQSEEAIT